MSDHKLAGLAKTLREQIDKQEEYDLDNYSEEAAGELMGACFAMTHPSVAPIRCTFVIGGGKSTRGRYEPNLYRGIAAALKAIGFEEDNGAALGSTGAFKSQHDTGRNIKVVHVFPLIFNGGGDEVAGGEATGSGAAVPLEADSPLYRLITAESEEAFAALCAEGKLLSYAQLQACNKALAPYLALLKDVDAKMMGGQPLSAAEEAWAAISSAETLQQKAGWVQAQMKVLVAKGELSTEEKRQLMQASTPKLEAIELEMATAQSEGKEKRVAALGKQREALIGLRAAAEKSKPPNRALPPTVATEVANLWAQCLKLRTFEASAKRNQQLLTIEQARAVGQLPELAERIADLAEHARGWFESDEALKARVALAKANGSAAAERAAKQQQQRAVGGGAGWATAGSFAKNLGAKTGAAKGGASKGGAFAALSLDD
ncbi:hypothetical protein T492DRAFT_635296 [Pavlovales sp. CCMP2436]|nr:hypothetical protein T492DRAFT_635296 [Pavlovales sp. CCMP2436]